MNVPRIVATLRVAGIALALYAVLGGLVPPAVPFFSGNWLNADTMEQAIGLPPLVFQALIALTLAVTIVRALEVFEVETTGLIEAMEQKQIRAAERERIARELHDGAIQAVYTAGLLVESARKQAGAEGDLAARLERAEGALSDAIGELRRSLGELRALSAAESLAAALERVARDPRFRSLVDVSLSLDLPDSASLSPIRTDHVLAIVSEALSNVVRHARARQVRIVARRSDGRLSLTVDDDGVGLPPKLHAGYGLRNMRDRARLLGGQLDVTCPEGRGASVRLDIPWSDEK